MDVAELAAGIRIFRMKYHPIPKPEENENASNDYLLILPLNHGRIKAEWDDVGVLCDGSVQPGTLWIVEPGERSRITPQTHFEVAILRVPERTLQKTAREYNSSFLDARGRLSLPLLLQARYDIQRLVPLLGMTSELQGPQRALLVSGVVLALLAFILNAKDCRRADQTSGFEKEQFETISAFARSRLSEHLDLAEWAASVKLSTNEFARRFQQHTGVAPYSWFMDRRIDEAKRMMLESAMPLVEVAFDSGFCSQAHFTEAFRRRVGTSPGRWRRRNREI
jgi:AraC-like DNA-binding protein